MVQVREEAKIKLKELTEKFKLEDDFDDLDIEDSDFEEDEED